MGPHVPHNWYQESVGIPCPRAECGRKSRWWCSRCGHCKLCVHQTPCILDPGITESQHDYCVALGTLMAAASVAVATKFSQVESHAKARRQLRALLANDASLKNCTRADLRIPLQALGYKVTLMRSKPMRKLVFGLFPTQKPSIAQGDEDPDGDYVGTTQDCGSSQVTTRSKKRGKRLREPSSTGDDGVDAKLRRSGLVDE